MDFASEWSLSPAKQLLKKDALMDVKDSLLAYPRKNKYATKVAQAKFAPAS